MQAEPAAIGDEIPVVDLLPWVFFDREGNRHLTVTPAFVRGQRSPYGYDLP